MPASDAVIEGVAGASGAIIALFATYPLLTVSTVQALKHKAKEVAQAERNSKQPHNGSLHDLKELVTSGGWTSLYAGLKPAVLGTAVSQGVYFYFYSLLRQLAVARMNRKAAAKDQTPQPTLDGKSQDIGVPASLAVASIAGCANVLLTNPVWVVVTQMQASNRHRGARGTSSSSSSSNNVAGSSSDLPSTSDMQAPAVGAWAVAKELYQEKGLLGMWQGVLPSLVMVSNPTIQYVLYEWLVARATRLRRAVAGKAAAKKLGPLDIFLLSAVAKLGATVATYPLLLVKNRLQALNRHTEKEMRYTGVMDAVQRIYHSEGLVGFYKGMDTKMVQTVVAAALLMVMKEQIYDATHRALRPLPSK